MFNVGRINQHTYRGVKRSYCHPGVNPLKSRLLRDHCNAGSLLDVGCGNGLYALDCQDRCSEIIQIDLEDRRDAQAQKFQFYYMNADDLATLDGPFDNIIAFDIIEHLDDDIQFLNSAYRLLKDGGKLFVSVPNQDNSLLERLNLAHIHFTDKTHRREYSQEYLKNILEETGFSVHKLYPHINRAVANMPRILQKNSVLSKVFAGFIIYQIRVCEMIGIFENILTADWLVVAYKTRV